MSEYYTVINSILINSFLNEDLFCFFVLCFNRKEAWGCRQWKQRKDNMKAARKSAPVPTHSPLESGSHTSASASLFLSWMLSRPLVGTSLLGFLTILLHCSLPVSLLLPPCSYLKYGCPSGFSLVYLSSPICRLPQACPWLQPSLLCLRLPKLFFSQHLHLAVSQAQTQHVPSVIIISDPNLHPI